MSNDIQARSKKELMEKIAPSHSLDKEKWMKLGDVIQEEIQKKEAAVNGHPENS